MQIQKLALMLVVAVVLMPMVMVVVLVAGNMVVSTMSYHAITHARAGAGLVLYLRKRATCILRIFHVRHVTVFRFALAVQPHRFRFVYGANDEAAENAVENY